MSKTKIPIATVRELWWKAAGRCEFKGCNKALYHHGVTMDNCNLANYAHIIADSPNGPRGTIDSKKLASDSKNLMLLCQDCHKYIDNEGKDKYDADTLFGMKKRHEERMEFLTGLKEDVQANIVVFRAKIASDYPEFDFSHLKDALLPNFYPTNSTPIELGADIHNNQSWEEYWKQEVENLKYQCDRNILNVIDKWEYKRIALFAFAPMPLLVYLGTLLNSKREVLVYQKQRTGGWSWQQDNSSIDFIVNKPSITEGNPALVLSLSASITERVRKERGNDNLWEITIDSPNMDFLDSKSTLDKFCRITENLLEEISKTSNHKPIALYLAAPVACCIELGRVWMPKANSPLHIYEINKKEDKLAIIINNK